MIPFVSAGLSTGIGRALPSRALDVVGEGVAEAKLGTSSVIVTLEFTHIIIYLWVAKVSISLLRGYR